MKRWEYFLKRLFLSIPILFLVITLLFIMLRLGPVDPVAARFGPEATGAEVERMRDQLGLNDPLWQQYLQFTHDLITFSGESWVVRENQAVTTTIYQTAPNTLWLGFWAILLPLFIGIPLGFYAGLHPNSWGDYIASVSGIIWLAMPNFWLAVMMLAILRRTDGGGLFGFDWYEFGPSLPGGSITGSPNLDWYSTTDVFILPIVTGIDWGAFASDFKLILPPALVLGSASMAAELRIGRTAMLETSSASYVVTAKAKGVKNRVLVWKHMFRNALVPLLPIITNEATLLIGGSVIVEEVFNINGLGRTFFLAAVDGDLPLAGALLFMFTVIIIMLNILQDLLYTIIDPRVGYDQ